MNRCRRGGLLFGVLLSLWIGCLTAPPAGATLLYKNYLVRQDRGRDILCEPYTVKKDDWIYKLFRESGEISQQDFPEFLRIFTRLNPHINNLDIIRPGEQILLPLKKVEKDSMPGQETGVVTIPFVNISNVPELLKTYSNPYEVRRGDYVSRLVAKEYGDFGTRAYGEGIILFRYLNPDVSDIDLIYPGQKLYIPTVSMKQQPWYRFLFDHSGKLIGIKNLEEAEVPPAARPSGSPAADPSAAKNPFAEAASILDGRLLNHGIYYFPQQGKEDVKLDLSQYPLIELKDGARILFTRNENIQQLDLKVLQSFWKELNIASVSPDADMEQILDVLIESKKDMASRDRLSFSDRGVMVDIRARWILDRTTPGEKMRRYLCITFVKDPREITAAPVINYLEQRHITIWDIQEKRKQPPEANRPLPGESQPQPLPGRPVNIPTTDPRLFVEKLCETLGYRYRIDERIQVAQGEAAVTVVCPQITGNDGKQVLVDFGDLPVDVAEKLAGSGHQIVPAKKTFRAPYLVEDLLRALSQEYSVNPVFFGARRAAYHNTRITVPGFLLGGREGARFLLSTAPLPEELIRFLSQEGLQLVTMQ